MLLLEQIKEEINKIEKIINKFTELPDEELELVVGGGGTGSLNPIYKKEYERLTTKFKELTKDELNIFTG